MWKSTLAGFMFIILLATCSRSILIVQEENQRERIESDSMFSGIADSLAIQVSASDSTSQILAPATIEEITTEAVTGIETETEIETEVETTTEERVTIESKYSDYEIYLLAKMVMAEAEAESYLCKKYVCQTILNRVSDDYFPDTVEGVLFQKNQFTPVIDGRWDSVEPTQECYNAVYEVINAESPILDSLYFECCTNSSWHSRNLQFITEEDGTRFYK